MLGGESPSFTRQCKTNNGSSTDQKSQAWPQHGTANVFNNYNILGSRMVIHALNHQHATLQFKLIGLDIFLSDNLNPDQFLLTQTFGCIAVAGGRVGGSPPDFHICALLVYHCAARSGTKRRRGQRLRPF